MKCNIYRVDQILYAPLQLGEPGPAELQQMQMLEKVVKEKALYFSYDYNLSQSAQTTISRIVEEESKIEEIKNDHD